VTAGRADASLYRDVIPKPVQVVPGTSGFALTPATRIVASPASAELLRIGGFLAERLRQEAGVEPSVESVSGQRLEGTILLTTRGAKPALESEGYELTVRRDRITLVANRLEGVFRGVQTLRQLLPADTGVPVVPSGRIADHPRFPWRGVMLDVARHFFGVADVKRLIDLAALYKLNRLHLHLSDDQGWRIAIQSWPRLATHGGRTAVGGGKGGYYTQEQYAEIVQYAASRYIVVVPEIDMPGHVNAALSAYPKLTCDGVAPPLYTGIDVGFSTLCIGRPATQQFVEDVVREVAALTPGPYLHIGGDEAKSTARADYIAFVGLAERIVRSHGKRTVGWGEIASVPLSRTTIVQHWHGHAAVGAVRSGAKLIMSPAESAYLDMKYSRSTKLGLSWAGYTSVRDAYEWDPVGALDGVTEEAVLGVESPLWSETLESMADVEYMAFPRLIGHAEIGWSQRRGRSWSEYRRRLAAQAPRLDALDVRFFRAREVVWR
jgi:hexosaminidase